MSRKLLVANRYLRSSVARRRAVLVSVSSSCAIEGIHVPLGEAPTPVGVDDGKARGHAPRRATANDAVRRRR